ncbi:hypothetical protein C8J56DRAFT_949856 [Mycena floridula]|nr:hypothetical protein C8J56DRAFT_949856 [Mycena floridula]
MLLIFSDWFSPFFSFLDLAGRTSTTIFFLQMLPSMIISLLSLLISINATLLYRNGGAEWAFNQVRPEDFGPPDANGLIQPDPSKGGSVSTSILKVSERKKWSKSTKKPSDLPSKKVYVIDSADLTKFTVKDARTGDDPGHRLLVLKAAASKSQVHHDVNAGWSKFPNTADLIAAVEGTLTAAQMKVILANKITAPPVVMRRMIRRRTRKE